jgi:peptidyl-prolyl cis-trans isomerase C
MKIVAQCFMVLLSGLLVMSGCEGGGGEYEPDTADLAAQVGDWSMTKDDIEEVISKLTQTQKKRYDTEAGRAQLTDRFLEEELFYKEGMRVGLDKEEAVQEQIDQAVRRIVIAEFYKKKIEEASYPSAEEARRHYEENEDNFISQEIIRARHLFTESEDKIIEMKKKLDEGEKLTTLIHKHSEDELTKKDDGDLGYFNPGGYIRFVGYSQDFSDAVFALEKGEISEPIKWEKGWSIVAVIEKRPEMLRPFDEVKDEISKRLGRTRIDEMRREIVAELRDRYEAINYYQEALELVQRSPEEIWNFAQATTDPYQRLASYKEIAEKFPDSEYTPQALFMVGFVSAEEIKDFQQAELAFNEVISKYPGSDVAKSAEWMLKNLNKPLPEFEDLEDLHQKISDDTGEDQ